MIRGRHKRSEVARNVRRLMREAGLRSAREVDRHTGVAAETVRDLLSGRTRTMTDANLCIFCTTVGAIVGRAIHPDEVRGRVARNGAPNGNGSLA